MKENKIKNYVTENKETLKKIGKGALIVTGSFVAGVIASRCYAYTDMVANGIPRLIEKCESGNNVLTCFTDDKTGLIYEVAIQCVGD